MSTRDAHRLTRDEALVRIMRLQRSRARGDSTSLRVLIATATVCLPQHAAIQRVAAAATLRELERWADLAVAAVAGDGEALDELGRLAS